MKTRCVCGLRIRALERGTLGPDGTRNADTDAIHNHTMLSRAAKTICCRALQILCPWFLVAFERRALALLDLGENCDASKGVKSKE